MSKAPKQPKRIVRYREASEENRSILAGLKDYKTRKEFIDYLRENEWTRFTPRPIEHATFMEIVQNDHELRQMMEREDDPVLIAELICRRYPHVFFTIEHIFQIFTDWKIKWSKRRKRVGGGALPSFSVPDHLLAPLEDEELEMVARRWFRREIKALNRNPNAAVKRLMEKFRAEKRPKQRRLFEHLLRIIKNFLDAKYPAFVDELVPGKPFPSVHVRLWIQQILERKSGLVVGSVGTQKTSAAVVGLEQLGSRAVIVFCRSYAKSMWADELKRYYRDPPNPFVVQNSSDIEVLERMTLKQFRSHRFIVVGYGNVQIGHVSLDDERAGAYGDRLARALSRLEPDGIVIDEGHAIKGNGIRSDRVLRVARSKSVKHRIILTATPFENRPNELARLATLLCPRDYPTPEVFLGACRNNPRIFFGLMTKLMCDYFAQEDVLDLPPTNTSIYNFFPTVELECTPDMKRFLTAVRDDSDMEARHQVINMTRFLSVPAAVRDHYPNLRHLRCFHDPLANPKLAYLKQEVARRIKKGKVVIASGIYAEGITRPVEEQKDLYEVAGLLEQWFPGKVLKIDGMTKGRLDIQRQWQTDPNAKILVASVPATSESLNFTLKKVPGRVERVTVFYLSLPWKPTQALQFNGRFGRPGSEIPLEVYVLVVKGTADEALLELNERKWRNFLIGVHGIPLQTEEEEALNRATFTKIVTTPGQWLKDVFAMMRGLGEAKLQKFLSKDFKELPVAETMAEYYLKMEEFGTSGHISRVTAPAISRWRKSGVIPSWDEVLDVGPGPLVLERRLDAPICSIDINPMMIDLGRTSSPHQGKNARVGCASNMPSQWSERFSFVIASLVLDLTSAKMMTGGKQKEIERSRVLREFNRVLKPGGLAWFAFQERCFEEDDSFDAFTEALKPFGFEPVAPWTNRIAAADHKSHPFAFWSVLVRKTGPVVGAKPTPPLFGFELESDGVVKRRPRKALAPCVPVEPDMLKHEQFVICHRNGSVMPVALAANRLTPHTVDPEQLIAKISKEFRIPNASLAANELRKQVKRLRPRSLSDLKKVWVIIREVPGAPRIRWADLTKLVRPLLAAS